jgi:ABC-type sugar transport system permease subunit
VDATPEQIDATPNASGNVRAWLLCAPACAVMVVFNLWPAGRALIQGPPLPISAELTNWGLGVLAYGIRALAMTGAILAIEVPLALSLALLLVRIEGAAAHVPGQSAGRWAGAILVGFSWRLFFGGTIGFLQPSPFEWQTVVVEVWRTFPLATLLLYAALRNRIGELPVTAQIEGAGVGRAIFRIYLPLCAPAIVVLASLTIIDYLRAIDVTNVSDARAAWTVTLGAVGVLALEIAGPRGEPR